RLGAVLALDLEQHGTPEVVDPAGAHPRVGRPVDGFDVQPGHGVVLAELDEEVEDRLLDAAVQVVLDGLHDHVRHQTPSAFRSRVVSTATTCHPSPSRARRSVSSSISVSSATLAWGHDTATGMPSPTSAPSVGAGATYDRSPSWYSSSCSSGRASSTTTAQAADIARSSPGDATMG